MPAGIGRGSAFVGSANEVPRSSTMCGLTCHSLGVRYRFQKCAEFDCLGRQFSAAVANLMKFQGHRGMVLSRFEGDAEIQRALAVAARAYLYQNHAVEGTYRDIADKLFITAETVKAHVHRIIQKLGASDRTQAVAIGVRRGIIHF